MLPSTDPFANVRRLFAQELARQESRLVDRVLSIPMAVLDHARGDAVQMLTDSLSLLGRLSHGAADASRGRYARPLTARE